MIAWLPTFSISAAMNINQERATEDIWCIFYFFALISLTTFCGIFQATDDQ